MRGILVAAIAVVVGTGCGSLDFQRPGSVVIYGRAAPLDQSWFGLVPPGDPPSVVGFGADGVGCLDGSPGTQVAWYDDSPAQGGKPRQIIGRIPADGAPLVLWVEIVDEGRLEFGQGVPDWWVGEPQTC